MINNYAITIGRYNDITPFFSDNRIINNYVIIRYSIWSHFKMESIDLEDDEYLILYDYFFNDIEKHNKVINNLMVEKFNKVSIKLSINLIKNINKQ